MAALWIRRLLRALGVLAVVLALAGFVFSGNSIFWVSSGAVDELAVEVKAPYLHESFYALTTICLIFYSATLICGVQFIRLRSGWWWLLAAVLALEVALQPIVGRLWLDPELGQSIGAATGIALGGLTPQYLLGFPYWAPIIACACHFLLKKHAP